MDSQNPAERSFDDFTPEFDDNLPAFENNAQNFDSLWNDYDGFDFQPSVGLSDAVPGVGSDINIFPYLIDNSGTNHFPLTESLSRRIPLQDDAFDFSTLHTLVQQDSPAPPPQHTLTRRRSKYMIRRSGSNTSPVAIPNPPSPFQPVAIQRWQNSPPEQEAASLSAIYNAMEQRPPLSGSHTLNFTSYRTHRGASSTTSLDSGVSDSSIHSVKSNQSSKSQRRKGKVTKPRTSAKGKAKPKDGADRILKCTFCCDTFKHKYDWARHEKSLHLSMEEWVCAPHGKL
jgi:hypothetical protein